MADSVTLTFKLSASYASETYANTTSTKSFTPESGSDAAGVNLQTIGTTWEALNIGDIDTTKRYWVCVVNKSTDTATPNTLTVKAKTTAAPAYGVEHVLYPGEGMVFPMPAYDGGYPIIGALFAGATDPVVQVVYSDAGVPQ